MTIGMIGSGSWATALVKILTDAGHPVHWCVRTEKMVNQIRDRGHNPNYLSSVHFNRSLLQLTDQSAQILEACDAVILAVPSAYLQQQLDPIPAAAFAGKRLVSAVKGILPEKNILLNDYLEREKSVPLQRYFTIMGPCHAEEVAAEKLS
jgi:glycerol-3-phosphate dehydrogenase (NAD(P)+)